MKKVVVGLSGGVDSAVTALLLKEQGFEVSAAYIQCWGEPGCRAEKDREDALKVALHLGIPFQVLDFRQAYKEQVLSYFYEEYKQGRTPNPDILCNSVIKFGLFYDWAMEQGYEYIATGHYSKIAKIKDQRSKIENNSNHTTHNSQPTTYLAIPKDIHKDQTYFLYQIPRERLEHILFPLGDYLKSEVREIARQAKLPVADKKDSMGICFVGDVNVPAFLKEKFGVMKGEVQMGDGTVVGEHDGYYLFTVGKRGTWKWKLKTQISKVKTRERFDLTNLPKLYVVAIRPQENVVVVGEREEASKQIFNFQFSIFNNSPLGKEGNAVHSASGEILLQEVEGLSVRIRNTGELLPVTLHQINEGTWQAQLEKPEFGISPGQSCVFYLQPKTSNLNPPTIVAGGGVIA